MPNQVRTSHDLNISRREFMLKRYVFSLKTLKSHEKVKLKMSFCHECVEKVEYGNTGQNEGIPRGYEFISEILEDWMT